MGTVVSVAPRLSGEYLPIRSPPFSGYTFGLPAITSGPTFLTHGLRCRGRYCDDVSLLNVESGYTQTKSWWTDSFSEEGNNERVCAGNGFVTGLGCSGDYCDSITLRCSQLDNGGVRSNCYWTEGISEESGGSFVAEDFRNPGGNDYRMDTWNNLVALTRGSGSPAWMNCTGSGCFDGIGHPLEQTGDLRTMRGCGKDGCGRSSVGESIPFQTQSSNWGVDNERWLFEATGDGHFTLRARHSGKCMDVAGASKTAGANVIQQTCNGNDNQRFRLLPYGNGYFAIQAKHSDQCLGIAGGATPGASLTPARAPPQGAWC
jgi:hypothetical protein